MTLQPPRRLARYVEPDVDDKRVDRVWGSVASRPMRAWPSWTMIAAAAGAVVTAGVLAFLVLRPKPTATDLAGVVVESGPSQTVTMQGGTVATLRERAVLRYDGVKNDRVDATVERGEVVFDVHHEGARAFVVHAAAFDIVDRGTRFVVGVDGESVRVAVETGSVEITRAHGSEPASTLAAGESWTNGPAPTTFPSGATVPTGGTVPRGVASVGPPSAPDALASATASSTAPSAPSASPTDSARGQASSPPGPREMLQAANDARLAGHPRDAAAAFDALRRRYRSDARAGLAAFELGRLRLDALGDPSGAAEAFADAIALAPGAIFREDAEARLVEALDRAHAGGRCVAARQSYLARFPHGLHAASVAARCP
jgi:transmembrane sensor